nr:MAG TPA: hypothetical protein [Caudoviricetes sp.]
MARPREERDRRDNSQSFRLDGGSAAPSSETA